jgi:hypothetical protein
MDEQTDTQHTAPIHDVLAFQGTKEYFPPCIPTYLTLHQRCQLLAIFEWWQPKFVTNQGASTQVSPSSPGSATLPCDSAGRRYGDLLNGLKKKRRPEHMQGLL